jgi:hypothetical protein
MARLAAAQRRSAIEGLTAHPAHQGGHLRLEGRSVIPSCPLHCLAPLVHHRLVAFVKPGSHLLTLPDFPESPLLQP